MSRGENIDFGLIEWKPTFTIGGKVLSYNRIPIANVSERIVEVPIGLDFLASSATRGAKALEVGNVLSKYENAASDLLGISTRSIVDKFERGEGIVNVDLMNLPAGIKYSAIVSISTVEHVGQGAEPGGNY